jgi:hypothetical protein
VAVPQLPLKRGGELPIHFSEIWVGACNCPDFLEVSSARAVLTAPMNCLGYHMNALVEPLHFFNRPPQDKVFVDRANRLLRRIDCQRANDRELQEAIGRLRYQAYFRADAIAPNRFATFTDDYDAIANAYLYALCVDGELASSLRLHIVSKEQLKSPSLEVFADHLRSKIDAGSVLIDATCFVTDERLSWRHRDLPYVTLRIMFLAAEYFTADYCLVAVRAEHEAFYRRAFNLQAIGEPRCHSQFKTPLALMALHFPTEAKALLRKYPFYSSSVFERRCLFQDPQEAFPGQIAS